MLLHSIPASYEFPPLVRIRIFIGDFAGARYRRVVRTSWGAGMANDRRARAFGRVMTLGLGSGTHGC